ncbi:RDD family protein [Dactylosporangium vinaceum]|uniref:RDD family protein n=1 Tax=Dactylosporangium vinaceum TaxID=53362 RepID=A0ABV5MLT5_9ACTN|nr:RDD family protein [Dactylosporangium vinaceum]UAB96901.1 RDD family protein [Dactylosporangium vinaceum]
MPPLPVPVAPNGMPLAGFGDRLLALLIDTAVLFGVAIVLAIPLFIGIFAVIAASVPTSESGAEPDAGLLIGVPLALEGAYLLLVLAAQYVYHVEMFGKTGITWGKRAMKLRIIRTDNPSVPLTRGVLAKRWATQSVVGIFIPFFSWIDGLWQLWDKPYQQCLHDKAAGTIVVKAG